MSSSFTSRLGTSPEEAIKAPVRVETAAANVTLSGEQTINSVALVSGDRILVKDQDDISENGIYVISTSAWSRATDWNDSQDVVNGILILSVESGKIYQAQFSGTFSAGTTEVTFNEILQAAGENTRFATVEVDAGDTTVLVPFTYTPNTGTLFVFIGGTLQRETDYTESAGQIAFPAGTIQSDTEVHFMGLSTRLLGVVAASNVSDDTRSQSLEQTLTDLHGSTTIQSFAVLAGVTAVTVPSYSVGVTSRLYYLNSVPRMLGTHITETNSTTVTLAEAPVVDSTLYVISLTTRDIGTAAASNVSDSTRNQSAQVTLDNNIYANVLDYGAVGDGVTDDTVAIQAAASSGKKVVFPKPSAFYAISDTIKWGFFSVAGNNDVLGYAASRDGVIIEGDSRGTSSAPKIKWIGDAQPGTTKVTKTDSVGNYDLITDAKPMISIVGGKGHAISGLTLDGDNKAHTGIHFEGNQSEVSIKRVRTTGVKVGIRNGTAWDYANSVVYWGHADSPYFKANVYDAPSFGGWQGDSHSMEACDIGGTIAPYATESSQNLGITIDSGLITGSSATYGMFMLGGRVALTGVGFIGSISTADIQCITGTCRVSADDLHSESGATYTLATGSLTDVIFTAVNSDAFKISAGSGGGKFSATNTRNVEIVRADGNNRFDLSLNNCEVDSISISSTVKGNVNLDIDNVTYSGGGTMIAVNDWQGSIKNVTPASALRRSAQTERRLNNENLTGLRWEKDEGYFGQEWTGVGVRAYGYRTIPSGTSTVVAKIDKFTNNCGSATLDLHLTAPTGANKVSHTDKLIVNWTIDSAGNVNVGHFVSGTNQVLDGYASLTTAYTIVDNGTDGTIDIECNQTNNLTTNLAIYFNGFVTQALYNTPKEIDMVSMP